MKTSIFLLTLFSLSITVAFSQKNIDNCLYAKYGKEELQKMQQNSPEQLDFLNFYVKHAGYFVDMPNKPIQYTDLIRLKDNSKNITANELINFNPYLYNCKNLQDKNSYYKAGNTGKLLIMISMKDLQIQYKNHKRMQNLKQ